MTTRQIVEIACLAVVCIASVRTWFWTPATRKFGVLLGVVAFVALALFITFH